MQTTGSKKGLTVKSVPFSKQACVAHQDDETLQEYSQVTYVVDYWPHFIWAIAIKLTYRYWVRSLDLSLIISYRYRGRT